MSKTNDIVSSSGKESAAAEASLPKAVVKRKASKLESTLPVQSTRKLHKIMSLSSGTSEFELPPSFDRPEHQQHLCCGRIFQPYSQQHSIAPRSLDSCCHPDHRQQ